MRTPLLMAWVTFVMSVGICVPGCTLRRLDNNHTIGNLGSDTRARIMAAVMLNSNEASSGTRWVDVSAVDFSTLRQVLGSAAGEGKVRRWIKDDLLAGDEMISMGQIALCGDTVQVVVSFLTNHGAASFRYTLVCEGETWKVISRRFLSAT